MPCRWSGRRSSCLLRGGADVTEATLSRFFGIHVLVLPLLLAGLRPRSTCCSCTSRVSRTRSERSRGPDAAGLRPGDPAQDLTTEKVKPFFPDYVLDEVIAWYAVMAAIVILASLFPAGLEAKANPLLTPEHIKPEWYFLGVYELLKLVPRDVGIIVPIGLVLVIVILPLLDRNQEIRPRRRPIAIACAVRPRSWASAR